MDLNNLIADAIEAAGGNGLVNGDLGCGCDVNDLAPCDSPDLDECRVAKSRVLGRCVECQERMELRLRTMATGA